MQSRLSSPLLPPTYGTFRTVFDVHRVHVGSVPQLRIVVGLKQELRIEAVPRHELLLS